MAKKKTKKKSAKNNGGNFKTVIIAAVVTFIVGAFIIVKYPGWVSRPYTTHKPGAVVTKDVSLYLTDEKGLNLKAYKHRITKATLEAELKEAVTALVKDGSGTIPAGTRLRSVRVKQDTAFVDFSAEIIKNHPGGSSGEMQTIYSIVDTITLNFPQVKDVQILVEGKTEKTLAGHIDISFPLGPDKEIIKD